MTAKAKVDRRLPRGVYALSLLMFLAGGILLLAALILPIQGTNFVGASVVPWYFYIGYAAYFLVVGWGLWAGRRWAYLAALLMCVVLAFYQFRTAIVLRLLLSIPLAYAIGSSIGLSGLPLSVGTIQAAMPTAVNMIVLALEFDAWPEFVGNGVVATTLGSLVSLTILIAFLR